MKNWLCVGVVMLALVLAGCGSATSSEPQVQLSLAEALGGAQGVTFERALEPRPFTFPADHGPHQSFAAEWWYYTGNLDTADGRHFGYQLTFFRFGMTPEPIERASDWRASNIYMAHFALSDVGGERFSAADRLSRDSAGLAGAQAAPFRVWVEDWSATSDGADGLPMRVQARNGDVSIDLTLQGGKPVVLQGERGLSQKSAEAGNASYYYSLTRMPTEGTISVAGQDYAVSGQSWMDREWSTSALAEDQAGWDWFAIQLSDGTDLMYYQLRLTDGTSDPYSKGTLVRPDGSTTALARDDVQLTVEDEWRSPRSGATYPARWRLVVPSAQIDLTLTPYLSDQELPLTVTYWEGAVRIEGQSGGQPVSGNAYVELTGYAGQNEENGVRVR